jgi:hypothetical protein
MGLSTHALGKDLNVNKTLALPANAICDLSHEVDWADLRGGIVFSSLILRVRGLSDLNA